MTLECLWKAELGERGWSNSVAQVLYSSIEVIYGSNFEIC